MTTVRRILARFAACSVVLSASLSSAGAAEKSETELWRALASGQAVALLRHATAPGFSDPPNFDLDDCSTQRNLSEEGRAEAARIGDAFRANGIEQAVVLSSQWCRALDTARLLDLGAVTPTPALNSFFEDRSSRAAQTQAVQQLIRDAAGKRPRVFVTHQVNITALSGQSSASGELIVVRSRNGSMQTLGRIASPD